MGGGGQTSTSSQRIDPVLRPLYANTADIIANLQPEIASQFGQFFGINPQQIPGFTPEQQAAFGLQGQYAFGPGLNAPQQQALSTLTDLTTAPFGQSPATLAAMEAVRNPVLNDLALAGLGNSDAVASNLASAYSPILAAEMQQRYSAIPQYQALGAQQFAQQTGSLQNYLGTAEQQRAIAETQGQANLADLLRRQQLGEKFSVGILGGFPSLGSTITKTSGSTGGIGK